MHADQFGQFRAGSFPFVSSFARLYHKEISFKNLRVGFFRKIQD